MYKIIGFILSCLLFVGVNTYAQTACSTLGQTPGTAFPVCGTDTFSQNSVPLCGGNLVPSPPCQFQDPGLPEINPFWYKFTCFSTGTLGFTIIPNQLSDDYDWQLFDITGHNPTDVYTNASLFVDCNWSGNPGVTGANATGTIADGCFGDSYAPISSMPTIYANHNYLLLISHFTPSQFGYKLSFNGGSASITDTTPPELAAARAPCDGTIIYVKLNKKMKCSSLAADGSDFSINTNLSHITSTAGINCDQSFDMDSISLTLSDSIPPGNYIIYLKNGSDGNTILDNCNNGIPVGDSVPVTINPQYPTPMDTLGIAKCAPDKLMVLFNKSMLCSSIAPDGSDFIITGATPVPIVSAVGKCNANGFTQAIIVNFAHPIRLEGVDTISLKVGTDGNTLLNQCGKESVAGGFLTFTTADTVSAAFVPDIIYGCTNDVITFNNPFNNHKKSWLWKFSDGSTDTLSNFTRQLPLTILVDTVTLFVSNNICSNSYTKIIPLAYDTLKAAFSAPEFYCPEDIFIVNDSSSGKIRNFLWQYSDGETSTSAQPPNRTFPTPTAEEKDYLLQLTLTDSIGCTAIDSQTIRVMRSCYIAVPSAFTPNGDGLNDFLYPLSGFKAINLSFSVYNRYGQCIFTSHNYADRWDGTLKGTPQPAGTYVWMINYIDPITNKPVSQKGTTVLIR